MEAAEAAMKHAALQELSFGSFFQHVGSDITHTADTVGNDIKHAAVAATPDLKWAAGEAWHGATACYANAECKAAVEKYGTKAVEAAMTKEALMNLNIFSGAEHWISGAAHTVENSF